MLRGRGGRIVLGYDNADMILQGLVPFEIGAITVTGDEDAESVTRTVTEAVGRVAQSGPE